MYPRNAASPPRISIGAVVQISDGAVQTSGVAVKIIPQGGSEASGAGTVAYSADGVVVYTPTQAETNYTAMVFVASKAGCIPATVTVVTSASETAGYAGLDWAKVGNPTTAVALSSTTISTSQAVASVTARVTANTDQWDGVAVTGMPLPTSSYTTPPAVSAIVTGVYAALPANHTVSGSYGVRLLLAINAAREVKIAGGSGHVAVDVHEFQPDVITDSALATSAITKIQAGLATLANQVIIAGYLDTEVAAIKSVTDKLNTGLVADNAVYQFTANMLELAPAGGGGGGSGDATEANQLLILGQLDEIQSKTDLISGASGITSLLAGAVLEPGTITSFPEVITIGDSYTEENGRAIQIPIVDTDGNPISSSGALYFADALVTFTISRANETEASRIIYGTAAVIDPPGTGTGDEAPYVLLELSSSETAKGLKKYRYTGVLKFTWPGTGTNVISFETATEITFDN